MSVSEAEDHVQVSVEGAVATLRLTGDLDRAARPAAFGVADTALSAGAAVVVLDGTLLAFADTSLVDLVIELRTRWPDRRIHVVEISPRVARLFTLCRVPLT